MKKIIGILGVAVFAMSMFFNTNTMNNTSGNLGLESLLNLNSANAECEDAGYTTFWKCNAFERCSQFGNGVDCT